MLKQLVNFLFIFFVTWWVVIFAVLPFGVKRDTAQQGDISNGNDKGAPSDPMLKKKFIITTIIAFVLTALYMIAINTGIIDLRNL